MMLYVTMYLTLINLNRFSNRVRLTICILLITCHLAVAYCLNTINYFLEGMGKCIKGEPKTIISDSQTPVYAKTRPLPYAIKEKVEDELSNIVKQKIISLISHSN